MFRTHRALHACYEAEAVFVDPHSCLHACGATGYDYDEAVFTGMRWIKQGGIAPADAGPGVTASKQQCRELGAARFFWGGGGRGGRGSGALRLRRLRGERGGDVGAGALAPPPSRRQRPLRIRKPLPVVGGAERSPLPSPSPQAERGPLPSLPLSPSEVLIGARCDLCAVLCFAIAPSLCSPSLFLSGGPRSRRCHVSSSALLSSTTCGRAGALW